MDENQFAGEFNLCF